MLFLIYLLIFRLCLCVDPDEDICENPVPDASVVSSNGNSYIFKGNYYWNTTSLDTENGITGFAGLITERWPHLTDKITAAFAIRIKQTSKGNHFTVFIVKNEWFAYKSDQIENSPSFKGKTRSWPKFSELNVNTAFTSKRETPKVFIVHNKLKGYILYDFSDMDRPTIVSEGGTTVRYDNWFFLDESQGRGKELIKANSLKASPGEWKVESGTLDQLYRLKTVMTYTTKLIMISDDFVKYCIIDQDMKVYEKKCERKTEHVMEELFKCPLDIKRRTTRPPPTKLETIVTESSKSVEPNVETNSVDSNSINTIRTSNTTLDIKPTDSSPEASPHGVVVATDPNRSQKDKSTLPAIYFMTAMVVVTLVLSTIICITSKIKYRKLSKGSVIYK